jgi:hypothetical protein
VAFSPGGSEEYSLGANNPLRRLTRPSQPLALVMQRLGNCLSELPSNVPDTKASVGESAWGRAARKAMHDPPCTGPSAQSARGTLLSSPIADSIVGEARGSTTSGGSTSAPGVRCSKKETASNSAAMIR